MQNTHQLLWIVYSCLSSNGSRPFNNLIFYLYHWFSTGSRVFTYFNFCATLLFSSFWATNFSNLINSANNTSLDASTSSFNEICLSSNMVMMHSLRSVEAVLITVLAITNLNLILIAGFLNSNIWHNELKSLTLKSYDWQLNQWTNTPEPKQQKVYFPSYEFILQYIHECIIKLQIKWVIMAILITFLSLSFNRHSVSFRTSFVCFSWQLGKTQSLLETLNHSPK